MPAAREWARVERRLGTPAVVVTVGAVMVMSGSWGRVGVVGCAGLVVGPDLSDGDQREADVAQPVQQAVQCGLVGDGTREQGEAVTGGQGEALEAGCPSGVEPALEADLVATRIRPGRWLRCSCPAR